MKKERRGALVAVATFKTMAEASVARGALEAAGIVAFVPGETGFRRQGSSAVLPSWPELQVFDNDREKAVEILKQAGHR